MMMSGTNGKRGKRDQEVKEGREVPEGYYMLGGYRPGIKSVGGKWKLWRTRITWKTRKRAVKVKTILREGMAHMMMMAIMIGTGTIAGVMRIGEGIATFGEHLADRMGEWARVGREIAAKQRMRAKTETRKLQKRRRRQRPKSPRGGGRPKKGEPEREERSSFFPPEGVG